MPLVLAGAPIGRSDDASPRLAAGPHETVRPLTLAHLWEADGMLLARYLTDRSRSPVVEADRT